jgi:hypothetical protein
VVGPTDQKAAEVWCADRGGCMLTAAIPEEGAPMERITRRTELLIGVGIVAAGALLAFVVPAVIHAGPARGIGYATIVIGVLVVIGVLLPPRRLQAPSCGRTTPTPRTQATRSKRPASLTATPAARASKASSTPLTPIHARPHPAE